MKQELIGLENLEVTVTNQANEDGEHANKVCISVSGILRKDLNENEDNYYVRIKEDYNGISYVSFSSDMVLEVIKNPSGRRTIIIR
jgi:hypothetical protein